MYKKLVDLLKPVKNNPQVLVKKYNQCGLCIIVTMRRVKWLTLKGSRDDIFHIL